MQIKTRSEPIWNKESVKTRAKRWIGLVLLPSLITFVPRSFDKVRTTKSLLSTRFPAWSQDKSEKNAEKMNFVRRREVKGRKDAWKKRMAMRRGWIKKKTKRRKKNIFCSCRGNRSDFEIPRDSANCELQCGKRKLLPVIHSGIQITIHVTNVKCRNKYDFLIQQQFFSTWEQETRIFSKILNREISSHRLFPAKKAYYFETSLRCSPRN